MNKIPVSYTHLDVYKRQGVECVSENDVVCEDVQTPSVSSVEDSEERKEVSCGPDEQLEDEDVQCSDGGMDVMAMMLMMKVLKKMRLERRLVKELVMSGMKKLVRS